MMDEAVINNFMGLNTSDLWSKEMAITIACAFLQFTLLSTYVGEDL